jgi:hypothetical protein
MKNHKSNKDKNCLLSSLYAEAIRLSELPYTNLMNRFVDNGNGTITLKSRTPFKTK